MVLPKILGDKTVRAKEKARRVAAALKEGKISYVAVYRYALGANTTDIGTCLEAICTVVKEEPQRAKRNMLQFAEDHLFHPGNRVRWEAAELVGHIAHRYPKELKGIVEKLFLLTEDESTVVRWNTSYALTEILLLPPYLKNSIFYSRVEDVMDEEENEGLKKKYRKALKKAARATKAAK